MTFRIGQKYRKNKERVYYDVFTDIETNICVTTSSDNRIVLTVRSCDTVTPFQQVNRWIYEEKKIMPSQKPHMISQ